MEKNENKKTYIVALNRDKFDTSGKSRAELSKIFKAQTEAVLPLFKYELKENGLDKDVDIKNLAPNLGVVIIDATPEDAQKIAKFRSVRTMMENQKIHIPRRPNNPKR